MFPWPLREHIVGVSRLVDIPAWSPFSKSYPRRGFCLRGRFGDMKRGTLVGFTGHMANVPCRVSQKKRGVQQELVSFRLAGMRQRA